VTSPDEVDHKDEMSLVATAVEVLASSDDDGIIILKPSSSEDIV
jgi:hypothetical protein